MVFMWSEQGTSKLKVLSKTLEEKKQQNEKHNKSLASPTEIQAVFMTLKSAK